MTTTAMTSELEAINTLLEAIGESPVNSLNASGMADLNSAKAVLNEVSRTVQGVGYHFNTEDAYPLPRNNTSRIVLAGNILKVSVQGTSGNGITQRGNRLYDKTNHRDTFESDLEGTVVLCLPWDDLPQAARHYIMIRASRLFQARTFGSDTQFRFSEKEEMDAYKVLVEAEGETGNYNIFTGSYSVTSIMER